MPVVCTVLERLSLKSFQLILRRIRAKKNVPKAPIPAASVGVKIPL